MRASHPICTRTVLSPKQVWQIRELLFSIVCHYDNMVCLTTLPHVHNLFWHHEFMECPEMFGEEERRDPERVYFNTIEPLYTDTPEMGIAPLIRTVLIAPAA